MLIKVVKSDLEEATSTVSRAVSTRSTLPVLTGINIKASGEKIDLKSTDLELSIDSTIPANVEEEGNVVVPAKPFFEIVKNLNEGQIRILSDTAGTELTIEGEGSRYKLRTFPPEDFPQGKQIPEGKVIKLSGNVLEDALKKVTKSASRDENRLTLTGIYVETGKNDVLFAATDSYRLAVCTVGCEKCEEGVIKIVPSRAFDELSKILNEDTVEIVFTENQMFVSQQNWVFQSRLIEGQFPAFKQLFPEESNVDVIVATEDLRSALKSVSAILKSSPVIIEVSEKEAKVRGSNSDLGEAEELIEVEANGNIKVAFNYVYLLEGIKNISSDRIKVEMQEDLNPAVIRPLDEEEYSYLLMPVRNE